MTSRVGGVIGPVLAGGARQEVPGDVGENAPVLTGDASVDIDVGEVVDHPGLRSQVEIAVDEQVRAVKGQVGVGAHRRVVQDAQTATTVGAVPRRHGRPRDGRCVAVHSGREEGRLLPGGKGDGGRLSAEVEGDVEPAASHPLAVMYRCAFCVAAAMLLHPLVREAMQVAAGRDGALAGATCMASLTSGATTSPAATLKAQRYISANRWDTAGSNVSLSTRRPRSPLQPAGADLLRGRREEQRARRHEISHERPGTAPALVWSVRSSTTRR